MKIRTFVRWFEPIGLALLLFSFGWQCLEEHINQMKMDGYILELNEKMLYIWEGIYDEALHSNRYEGNTTVYVNYDAINSQIKDWNEVELGMSTLKKQSYLFFWIRVSLFVIGSILIIAAKWPKKIEQ